MIFKRFISSVVLALLMAMASFQAAASQISAGAAQSVANNFIKCHSKAVPGSINAPALADIVLTHAEPSDKVVKANVYYIFNIKGGGFIIVSGDDHAAPVLGYSDKGHIDVGNMSESLQDMLGYYKAEIDYLLTHDTKASKPLKQNFREATTIVEPMTKSTWGPEEPYYNMCPMKGGVHDLPEVFYWNMAYVTFRATLYMFAFLSIQTA